MQCSASFSIAQPPAPDGSLGTETLPTLASELNRQHDLYLCAKPFAARDRPQSLPTPLSCSLEPRPPPFAPKTLTLHIPDLFPLTHARELLVALDNPTAVHAHNGLSSQPDSFVESHSTRTFHSFPADRPTTLFAALRASIFQIRPRSTSCRYLQPQPL